MGEGLDISPIDASIFEEFTVQFQDDSPSPLEMLNVAFLMSDSGVVAFISSHVPDINCTDYLECVEVMRLVSLTQDFLMKMSSNLECQAICVRNENELYAYDIANATKIVKAFKERSIKLKDKIQKPLHYEICRTCHTPIPFQSKKHLIETDDIKCKSKKTYLSRCSRPTTNQQAELFTV